MINVLKGFSILLIVSALLLFVACSEQETTPTIPSTVPVEESAVEAVPSPTAPPAAVIPEDAKTAEPPTPSPTVQVEPEAEPVEAVPPVSSPTIIIPEAEPVEVEPAETAVPPTPAPIETSSEPPSEVSIDPMPRFAGYFPWPVKATPAMFHDPISPDMSNVHIPFAFSPDQLDRLGQNGIVVSPGTELEFFTVYEKARYDNLPVFVTSDSMLHSYHLVFDKVLRTAESQSFIPLLQELNEAMMAQTDAQYQSLLGTAWEDAARHAVAFIGVGSKLLDPQIVLPE